MKKWIVATLMTLTAICASTGARSAAPAEPDPVAYGGCRWECPATGALYLTSARCQAVCSTACEEIC